MTNGNSSNGDSGTPQEPDPLAEAFAEFAEATGEYIQYLRDRLSDTEQQVGELTERVTELERKQQEEEDAWRNFGKD